MRIRLLAFCLGAALGAALPAQQQPAPTAAPPAAPPAARLQALLDQLAITDAKVWAEHLAGLEQQAKAREAEAAQLRAQATALQQQATQKDAAAKQLRAEIERLQQLQALAATLPKPAPEQPPPAKAAESKPASPKAPPKTEPPPKAADQQMPPAADPAPTFVTWNNQIADLFEQHCASCHDPDSNKGGLDVTSFAAMRQGGGSGRTLVAGAPERSRLFLMINQQERPFMPKGEEPLPADAIAKVRQWIEQGACEDDAAAREFAAQRQKAAANTAAAATADAEVPLPQHLPTVPLQVPPRPAPIKSLVRSPRAPLLAMPGMQQVLLFDADMHLLFVLPCRLPQVEAVGFSPDGATLFAAGGERGKRGQLVLYDVQTGAQLAVLGSERDTPLAAAVAPGRAFAALGGSGKHTRVYDRDGKLQFEQKHDDFVLGLAFSADGKLLAAADRSGVVQVYETDGGRIGQTLGGHQGAVNAVAFRGNRLLASAGADGTVRLWDATTGKEQWRQAAHRGEALAVAFGPDDRIASCGSDGRMRVFAADGKPLAQSPDAGDWLYGVAFGATADVVFAGDWQGRVHRFDLRTKKLASATPLAAAQ